jgi:hypothetical protein
MLAFFMCPSIHQNRDKSHIKICWKFEANLATAYMRFCLNMTSVPVSVKFTQFITLKKDCKTIHFIDIIQRCSLSSVAASLQSKVPAY